MLIAIYQASGYRALTKWVDDFFVVAFPDDVWTEAEFMGLTSQLGVPLEQGEDPSTSGGSTLHRVRLGSLSKSGVTAQGETVAPGHLAEGLGITWCSLHGARGCLPAWKAGTCLLNLQVHSAISSLSCPFFKRHPSFSHPSPSFSILRAIGGPLVGTFYPRDCTQCPSPSTGSPSGSRLVGRCQHLLWHWHCGTGSLGRLAVCTWLQGRPWRGIRHWLGRSCSSGNWP